MALTTDPVRLETILRLKKKGHTFEEIGKVLKITRQRVHQIYKKYDTERSRA